MMSNPVSAQGLLPEFTNRTQGSFGVESVQETEKGEGFQSMLEKHTEKWNTESPKTNDIQKTSLSKTPKEMNVKDSVTEMVTVEEMEETQNPLLELSEEEWEKVMEVLQSAILQIQDSILNQFDLTSEEFSDLLQSLELEPMDLLQFENINELVLEGTGNEDILALVTDEALYQTMQELKNNFEDIIGKVAEALEVEPDALVEELPKMIEYGKEFEVHTATSQSQEINPFLEANEETLQVTPPQQEDGLSQKEEKEQASPNQIVQSDMMKTNTILQPFVEEVELAMAPDAQEIMDQIMEFVKVTLEPEMTSLQMQLHPESLGTLQIQISAKEGIMTAQFTAESLAVKAVLEGQMIQLQESFLQQDIKVEAIEVTVATHQFESNLEQGREGSEQEEAKQSKRRRIDLSRLEETEELSDVEELIAKIMSENGNSVDYLA